MPTREELIASDHTVDEICAFTGLEESIDLSLGEGVTEFAGALLIGP